MVQDTAQATWRMSSTHAIHDETHGPTATAAKRAAAAAIAGAAAGGRTTPSPEPTSGSSSAQSSSAGRTGAAAAACGGAGVGRVGDDATGGGHGAGAARARSGLTRPGLGKPASASASAGCRAGAADVVTACLGGDEEMRMPSSPPSIARRGSGGNGNGNGDEDGRSKPRSGSGRRRNINPRRSARSGPKHHERSTRQRSMGTAGTDRERGDLSGANANTVETALSQQSSASGPSSRAHGHGSGSGGTSPKSRRRAPRPPRRKLSKKRQTDVDIMPFPLPSDGTSSRSRDDDQDLDRDDDHDGAVVFRSRDDYDYGGESGDSNTGMYIYSSDEGDDGGGSSADSTSTANSRLDQLLDRYFPDEMGGQGTVHSPQRSPPASPKRSGWQPYQPSLSLSGSPGAGQPSSPGSSRPYRQHQRTWAGRALKSPLFRERGVVPTLSPSRDEVAVGDDAAGRPTGSRKEETNFLSGAPPLPLSLRQRSAPQLSPRRTPRRPTDRGVGGMGDDNGDDGRSSQRALSPDPPLPPAALKMTRSLSETSALDHSPRYASSYQHQQHNASTRSMESTTLPRYRDAFSAHLRSSVRCDGISLPPGCCDNMLRHDLTPERVSAKAQAGVNAYFYDEYFPDYCRPGRHGPTITPDPSDLEVGSSLGGGSRDPLLDFDALDLRASQSGSPPPPPAPELASLSGHPASSSSQNGSLVTSIWLEDIRRQYEIKEQNRSRMIAAMAKAARAHSQLASDAENDRPYLDDDLDRGSIDFDDLGQRSGFGGRRSSRRRSEPDSRPDTSNTATNRTLFETNEPIKGERALVGKDSSGSAHQSNGSDSEREEDLNEDSLAERDLARKARLIREQIRRREMAELAAEAERAAEAGEERFIGAASTFDVVLAASAAAKKAEAEKEFNHGELRGEEDGGWEKRAWEWMFDAGATRGEDARGRSRARRNRNRQHRAFSTPPSSPVKEMVGWVSNAMSIYDPSSMTPRSSEDRAVEGAASGIRASMTPTLLSRASMPDMLNRRTHSESFLPSTPLHKASMIEQESRRARFISALSTPLTGEKKHPKVPVLELRHIEEIVPQFGKMHMRLRTDMAGKGVDPVLLGGPPDERIKEADGDRSTNIGSESSANSFQHLAVSLKNLLLKSATAAGTKSAQNSAKSVVAETHAKKQDGAVLYCGNAVGSMSPKTLPPMSRRSSQNTAGSPPRPSSRMSGPLDCTRPFCVRSGEEARAILDQELGATSDSSADDTSVASFESSSTTDLMLSTLTSEIHTPRTAARLRRKFGDLADSPMGPFFPPDSPGSTVGTPLKSSKSMGAYVPPLSLSDPILSINTPKGGRRTFTRGDSGGLVEAVRPSPKGVLYLPDLSASASPRGAMTLTRALSSSGSTNEDKARDIMSAVPGLPLTDENSSNREKINGNFRSNFGKKEGMRVGFLSPKDAEQLEASYWDSDVDSDDRDAPLAAAAATNTKKVQEDSEEIDSKMLSSVAEPRLCLKDADSKDDGVEIPEQDEGHGNALTPNLNGAAQNGHDAEV